ncbi:metallophosphoesterase [Candidatus Chlorohelix sp.]|uniref:metallophosphoesterase n=1 Tax=Candidatus Chlorohelix sp. TaxID=3139201 RepID=UPI003034EF0E
MFIKTENNHSNVKVTLKLNKAVAIASAISGITALLYARMFERKWLEVTNHRVEIHNLPQAWQGFRFAWMSDLHLGYKPSYEPVRAAFDRVIAAKPDLILLGGDYMDRGKWKPVCDELFGKLAASGIPIVGIWGNHDYFGNRRDPDKNLAHFEQLGIRILINEDFCMERQGIPQYFIGLDDILKGVPEPIRAKKYLPEGAKPLVTLSHNPNYIRRMPENYSEIVLSGHTHGGQLNPLPLHRKLNWLRYSTGKHHSLYPTGWYNVNGNRLYTGRGVGVTHWPLRFGSRPELAIFELQSCN